MFEKNLIKKKEMAAAIQLNNEVNCALEKFRWCSKCGGEW